MVKRMLIDATHAEETRVVVLDGLANLRIALESNLNSFTQAHGIGADRRQQRHTR